MAERDLTAMTPCDIVKKRDICFSPLPPGQASRALALLRGLENLEIAPCPTRSNAVSVSYSVLDYTLKGLEGALEAQGFHLENSLLQKIVRALVYYCEEVQLANLRAPERQQKAREIFVKAYDHHPHGDHDETPEEWREYR